jgi:hypothetical protein
MVRMGLIGGLWTGVKLLGVLVLDVWGPVLLVLAVQQMHWPPNLEAGSHL